MYIPRYESLRKRLALPFGLLGLVISALLSALAFGLAADIEEHAIRRVLLTEMESFRNRKERNPAALPPSATLIQGDFLPSASFPSIAAPTSSAGAFQRQQIDGRNYTVLVGDIAGEPYALLYDRTVSESGLVDLGWALAAGTLLMGALSALIGHIAAGEVVRPIRRLLTEISERSAAMNPRAGAPVSFSAEGYPANEIGQLVRALDEFALRLHGFVQRETFFAADVSHELRNPIAVIRGTVEVLAESSELSDSARERLRAIQRRAGRMGEILEAMLLLAREDDRYADPACAMVEVIEEAIADCEQWLVNRPVEVVLEIIDRPIVSVERPLAYVVLSNLLRNACAHTRQGCITVQLMSDRVEIIDTGIGIPEERFPGIFQRHVKGEESVGSGLGLSIVSRIADKIRWDISVKSRSGTGTHVVVRFAPSAAAVT